MKTLGKLTIGLFFLTLGCTNSTQDKTNVNAIDNKKVVFSKPENSLVYVSGSGLWEYDYDPATKKFKAYKLRPFLGDTLTAQRLENIINNTWPKVQIKYLRTSKDTILIAIPNSEVLTQQMGTTGSDQFMVSTTYSFTELKGIKYVSFTFEPGDHANPGTYDRNSWKEIPITENE